MNSNLSQIKPGVQGPAFSALGAEWTEAIWLKIGGAEVACP